MTPTVRLFFLLISATAISAWLVIQDPRDEACSGKAGPKCSSECDEVVFCPAVNGAPIHVMNCPEGKFCGLDAEGKPSCSATSCKNGDFICTTPGGVPDPENPAAYYLCPGVSTTGIARNCTEGKFFNPVTSLCDLEAQAYDPVTCDPIDSADPKTQYGTIGTDETFCFVCNDRGNPLVYLCNTGEYFYENPYQLPPF